MKPSDLKQYIGKYVSFDLAIIPPNNKNTDTNCHYEGWLIENNGRLSHFALEPDTAIISLLSTTFVGND